jgi:hypothetical protein
MKHTFINLMLMYAIYYPGGCVEGDVPDHICSDCGDIEHGRVRSVAFIKKSFVFADPSSPAEWLTGIASKDIIIIPNVRGAFNGGDPQSAPGYGDQSERNTGYNMELTFQDPDYGVNGDFYNALKNSKNYRVGWRTETQTHISDKVAAVFPNNPQTDDLNSEVTWNVAVRWSQSDLAIPMETPAGVFDACFDYVA